MAVQFYVQQLQALASGDQGEYLCCSGPAHPVMPWNPDTANGFTPWLGDSDEIDQYWWLSISTPISLKVEFIDHVEQLLAG